MQRRRFLTGTAGLVALGLAGCSGSTGGGGSESGTDTPTPTGTGTPAADRGIYIQSFREEMSMQGTASAGDYRFALMFTVPHTFWTVTGDELSKTPKEPDDSLHLMASVWDPETGTVVPETGLSVELRRDGDLVSQEVIYPMLSQPMGFHYGGNFALPGDGEYTARVSVGGTSVRRTGAFGGRFGEPAEVEIPLSFTPESRESVTSEPIDKGGDPGALRPMDMMMPQAVAPAEDALPGTVRGSELTDDARFVVTTLAEGPVDGGPYLAVSARTRYNGYVLPAMALSATLDRDGETVYDGPLTRTLDPELGYHYGAAVDGLESGDELTVEATTPPQVARHEGYERALLRMDDVSVIV